MLGSKIVPAPMEKTILILPPGSLGDVKVLTVLGLEIVVVKLKATPESGLSVDGLAQRPSKANRNRREKKK